MFSLSCPTWISSFPFMYGNYCHFSKRSQIIHVLCILIVKQCEWWFCSVWSHHYIIQICCCGKDFFNSLRLFCSFTKIYATTTTTITAVPLLSLRLYWQSLLLLWESVHPSVWTVTIVPLSVSITQPHFQNPPSIGVMVVVVVVVAA